MLPRSPTRPFLLEESACEAASPGAARPPQPGRQLAPASSSTPAPRSRPGTAGSSAPAALPPGDLQRRVSPRRRRRRRGASCPRPRSSSRARGRGFSIWVRGEQARGPTTSSPRPRRRASKPSTRCRRCSSTDEPSDAAAARRGRAAPAEHGRAGRRTTGGWPRPPTRASASRPRSSPATPITPACSPRTSSPSSPTSTASRSSIAMTIVSHGVAGIYWVGSLERARGQGARPSGDGGRDQRRLRSGRRGRLPAGVADGQADLRRRWATRRPSTTGC